LLAGEYTQCLNQILRIYVPDYKGVVSDGFAIKPKNDDSASSLVGDMNFYMRKNGPIALAFSNQPFLRLG
jgi:hypothetical protein